MTRKLFSGAACALTAALLAAPAAMAQTAAATPAITQGPPIPGLCVISVEMAIGNSAVGKSVEARLQQIQSQANAELNGEKAAIDTEAKALDGQRATLAPAAFEQKAGALQARFEALQRKAALREREIGATEQKALGRIGSEMDPLVRTAYQQKNCSVLLQRTAVVILSPAMDITPQVVTALNAKIQTFAFEREHLDQAAAGAPPAR
jgi:Skp family chaperone for outer membrane proteins